MPAPLRLGEVTTPGLDQFVQSVLADRGYAADGSEVSVRIDIQPLLRPGGRTAFTATLTPVA